MLYGRLRPVLEKAGVPVYGYLPEMRDCVIESRHLGLMLPGEIEGLRERIGRLAEQMEESLDMEGLIALARRGRRDRKPAGTPSVLRAVSSAVWFGSEWQEIRHSAFTTRKI